MNETGFTIPHIILIAAFVSSLLGIAGWILNLEIRKADRSEIIGKSYKEVLENLLESIQRDLSYIRQRFDEHSERELRNEKDRRDRENRRQ